MKLLQIIMSTNPSCGGPSAVIREQCTLFLENGIVPTVVTIDEPDAPWLATEQYTQIGVGHGYTGYGFFNGLDRWLDLHIQEYDRVIVHGLWGGHVFPAHKYAKKYSVPYFVIPHGMLDPWFNQFRLKHLKKLLFWHWAEYPLLRDARKVIFTCQAEMEKSYHSFKRYSINPVVSVVGVQKIVVPENPRFLVDTAYPELHHKKIILFMSRLHPIKGIENLLNGWHENPDHFEHALVIAGPSNDNYGEAMKELAQTKGMQDVLFTGMVSGEIRASLLASAELFVQPSYLESFGMSVVEALSVGTPVLVTDNVGVYQEIKQLNAGLIAQPTKESIKEQISVWCGMTAREKDEFSKNAISCFDEKFEIGNAVKSLLKVIGQ